MSPDPVALSKLLAVPAPPSDQPATKDPDLKPKAYCQGTMMECPQE